MTDTKISTCYQNRQIWNAPKKSGAIVALYCMVVWIYNYLCNPYLSPLMLLVWIPLMARCTTLCDKVCQWHAAGGWFSQGAPVSSTNKTNLHDIAEILLKVALNTIKTIRKKTQRNHESDNRKVGFPKLTSQQSAHCATDSSHKYLDTSNFPYIFHFIKLQFFVKQNDQIQTWNDSRLIFGKIIVFIWNI